MAILNCIIDDDLKDRIDAYAKADDRTIRSVVEAALREYFDSRARQPVQRKAAMGCLDTSPNPPMSGSVGGTPSRDDAPSPASDDGGRVRGETK